MLQTAAGFSMAGPMFFLGIESLRTGQYEWGVFYLTLGALVLYFPTYLVKRIGGPRTWIRRRFGRSETDSGDDRDTATDDETTASEGDSAADSEGATLDSTLVDRLRRR